MALDAVFTKKSPLTVMARQVMQRALSHVSTTGILFAIDNKDNKQAAFIIREHGVSPNPTELEAPREVGRVFEQAVRIEDKAGCQLKPRRIKLHLDEPTEDGETVICLLTNVPAERARECYSAP